MKKVWETNQRQGTQRYTTPAEEQKAGSQEGEGGGDEEISAKTNQSGLDNGFHAGVLTPGQLVPWPAPSGQRLQKKPQITEAGANCLPSVRAFQSPSTFTPLPVLRSHSSVLGISPPVSLSPASWPLCLPPLPGVKQRGSHFSHGARLSSTLASFYHVHYTQLRAGDAPGYVAPWHRVQAGNNPLGDICQSFGDPKTTPKEAPRSAHLFLTACMNQNAPHADHQNQPTLKWLTVYLKKQGTHLKCVGFLSLPYFPLFLNACLVLSSCTQMCGREAPIQKVAVL